MELKAELKDGVYTLTLTGAPASSVVEVRFQNTFNGLSYVEMVDVKSDGTALVPAPLNFAQNFRVDLVVLTADNKDNSFGLVFAGDDQTGNLRLVQADSPLLNQPTTAPQPAAQQQPAPAMVRPGVAPAPAGQ